MIEHLDKMVESLEQDKLTGARSVRRSVYDALDSRHGRDTT